MIKLCCRVCTMNIVLKKDKDIRKGKGRRSRRSGEEFIQFLVALAVLHWTIWIIGWIAPGWFERKGCFHPILQKRYRQNSLCGKELNQFCPQNSSDDLCLLFSVFCLYPSSMNRTNDQLVYIKAMYKGWEQGGIKIIYGSKPMCTARKISIKKVNYLNLMMVYYYHLPFNKRLFPMFLNLGIFQLCFF